MKHEALFTPIRRRLVGWTVLVVSVILLVLGGSVYVTVARSLMDQVNADLVAKNQQALEAASAPPGGPPHQGARNGYSGGAFFLALGADGQVLFNPQQVQVDGVAWPTASASGTLATVTVNGEPARVLLTSHTDGSTSISGESLRTEMTAIRTLLLVLVGGGALGLLLTVWAAWFLSGRALVPIQAAFRRQQEFVADASHELRTPLTVLRSAADLLSRHTEDRLADHADLLEDIRAEIGRMQLLSQDLLTLARSDHGQLQLLTAPISLEVIASDVMRRVMPLAASRGQILTLNADRSKATVEADPDRFQQVLFILMDNAIKYTPDGGRVDVAVRVERESAVVEVADSGRGIAAEHLPRLFDRFYRGDAARSRSTGGAGLGLAIAKALVDAHQGELSIRSSVGVGTVARVRLPLTPESALAESAKATPARPSSASHTPAT
jgi:signal transduction histidine kinase